MDYFGRLVHIRHVNATAQSADSFAKRRERIVNLVKWQWDPFSILDEPALFHLTHGGKDDTVPPAMSEAFHRLTGCDLVLLPDEDHYGHLDPKNPLWAAVLNWLGPA